MTTTATGGSSNDATALRSWLRRRIAETLNLPPDSIDTERGLSELGLSSVQAVALVTELEKHLGREVGQDVIWSHPSIDALVGALTGDGAATSAPAAPTTTSTPVTGERQPVAVVGAGCRLPGGVTDLDSLWELLESGRSAVSTVPDGRWSDFGVDETDPSLAEVPRAGGFLGDVAGFDADFFGILPREAELMDPQQRMLLEVTWNALEHAGISPASLRGSRTGVFVGAASYEYGNLTTAELGQVDAWTATGAAPSILSNRLSYVLDLRGPSLTVDTACSSSLVALHQACLSLSAGECDTAVVAGVNLLLSPAITLNFARAGVLSATGGCRPFDADADGIVRGEGVGVVVLRRLPDARRDGSRILAVVKGSAVNSDGRSNGLMAPNPQAQSAVLAQACAVAGVKPSKVDYVEAHGTGTPLGDPIEAMALGEVHGAERTADRPLLLGSVKSTFGHLEAAAGMAGLLKVVASMTHDTLPASLGYDAPNPQARLDERHLAVVDSSRRWPRYSGRPVAGVSGFGFGGTNAHVVLEAWPSRRRRPAPTAPSGSAPVDGPAHVLALGAPDPARLQDLAARLADVIETSGDALTDVSFALSRRDPGRVRAYVAGRGRENVVAALRGLDTSAATRPEPGTAGPVLVFSGHGSQYTPMGAGLLGSDPHFRAEVERLDPWFVEDAGFALSAALQGDAPAGLFTDQLSLFGLQVALAASWRARGLEPAAVVGHSMGEVAAAVVAGALDARDGLRVMAARSTLLADVDASGAGAMAAVELAPHELEQHRDVAPDVTVAVHAAPTRCTLAGPAAQVQAVVERLDAQGRLARLLKVGGAGHSAAVDPILPRLREALSGLEATRPTTRFVSTVDPHADVTHDVDYWLANARRTVRFADAIGVLLEAGHRSFVEVSPHPIAIAPIEECAVDVSGVLATGSLRRGEDDDLQMAHAVGRLHAHGHSEPLLAACAEGSLVPVPETRWEHRPYWLRRSPVAPAERAGHPLLGRRVAMPGRHAWHTDVGTDSLPWLADHEALGVPILPGAAYLEMVLSAAVEAWALPTEWVQVRDLELVQVLPLVSSTPVTVVLTESQRRTGTVEVLTAAADGSWVLHARAEVTEHVPGAPSVLDVQTDGDEVDVYARFASVGQEYGPAFRGVVSARAGSGLAVATVRLPVQAGRSAHDRLHPALVDAALHVLAAAVEPDAESAAPYLPVGIGRVEVHAVPAPEVQVLAEVRQDGADRMVGSVRMLDADGRVVVELADVGLRRLSSAPVRHALGVTWIQRDLPALTSPPERCLVVDAAADRSWPAALTGLLMDQSTPVHTTSLADLGTALADPAWRPDTVVVVCPVAGPGCSPDPEVAEQAVADVATVARRIAELEETTDADGEPVPVPRLWLVTEGAAVTGDADQVDLASAALRGLVRVLAFEHPTLHARAVDLEPGRPATESARHVLDEISATPSGATDDEVAYRHGRRLAARVRRLGLGSAGGDDRQQVTSDGAYVLTGGLGGIGLVVARHLAELGAGRLVLTGRRGLTPDVEPQVEALRALGTDVVVVAADLAAPGGAEEVVAAGVQGGFAVRGVVHAAGVLADATLARLDRDDLHRVWWPKAHGAVRLHEATRGQPLDWWLTFSSVAGLLGSPGQSSYATANAWLDAWTSVQRAQGVRATSVQWGAWGEVGAVADSSNPILAPMSPDEAMRGLAQVVSDDLRVVALAHLAVDEAAEMFPELRGLGFLSGLLTDENAEDAVVEAGHGALEAVRRLGPDEGWTLLVDQLRGRVASIAGLHPDELDPALPLSRLGLDSLMAMRARNAVQQDYEVVVPVGLLLKDASVIDVAAHVAQAAGLSAADATPTVDPVSDDASVAAVVGIDPRDTTERVVAQAWRAELRGSAVFADDRFDALGGDADSMVAVAARLSQRLGAVVDPAQFDLGISVEHMADALRHHVEPRPGEVTRPLAPGRDGGPTLFMFHPAGGPTSVYVPLVSRLDSAVRCIGMERLDDHDTVEAKADVYRDLVVEHDPQGPYRLGGWSFGGCLALEVAQRLRAEGREVEVVAMIDSILPLPAEPGDVAAGGPNMDRFRRFVDHLAETYGAAPDIPWDRVEAADEDDQIAIVVEAVSSSDLGIGAAALHHQYTSYVDARIAERYDPRPYDGRVVLYRATEPHPLTTSLDPRYKRTDDDLGWAPLCAGLEIVKVAGDHLSVIDPPAIDTIAAHLDTVVGSTVTQEAGR